MVNPPHQTFPSPFATSESQTQGGEELFPGFQRRIDYFSNLYNQATKNAEQARDKINDLMNNRPVAPRWLAGVVGALGPIGAALSAANVGSFRSEEDWQKELQMWQARLDQAIYDQNAANWKVALLSRLPNDIADPANSINSVDDVLKLYGLDGIRGAERNWATGLLDEVKTRYVELFGGDPNAIPDPDTTTREQFLDDLLADPTLDLRAVHNLSVDELVKSFRTGPSEVVSGMSWDDVADILKNDPEYMDNLQDVRAQAEEFQKMWAEQQAAVALVRAGVTQAEIPELTAGEKFKMLFTQPALAALETMEAYFNALPRPLATYLFGYTLGLSPGSDASELRELHQKYQSEGMGAWEAASQAYQDWDTNGFIKIVVESLADPTTYIGLGIATRIAKPIPYVGRFVGAFEQGWIKVWDAPFRGLKTIINKIPKTPFQQSVRYAQQAVKDTRAYFLRYFEHDWIGMSKGQVTEALEFAVKSVREAPQGIDWPHQVGRYMTEHDYIAADTIESWFTKTGKPVSVSPQMALDVNDMFELYFRGTNTVTEMSDNILRIGGIEPTKDVVARMSKNLTSYSDSVYSSAEALARAGTTPRATLKNFLDTVERTNLARMENSLARVAEKQFTITGWLQRGIDKFVRNSIMTKVDRYVTAPLANQYLLFTNYGPFNFLENVMRSFLGSGQMFYPKSASPVDEAIRFFDGLTEAPFEFSGLAPTQRLEIAVTNPETGALRAFEGGKIPYITRAGPIGPTITIGTKKYPIRSAQDFKNMWGDIGEAQRAWYMVTRYKQELLKTAPEQVEAISSVIEKHRPILEKIGFFDKKGREDIIRVLEQDATVNPRLIRAHDVPLTELESRKALLEVNKVLDRCGDIYSIQKNTIREEILSGRIWNDIDGRIKAVGQSIREFDVAGLQVEIDALNTLTREMASFAPQNADDMLRTMGFISEISDAVGERISEVRKVTQARASELLPKEAETFHKASAKMLGDFLDTAQTSVDDIMKSFRTNMSRPRTLLDDVVSNLTPWKAASFDDAGTWLPIVLDGQQVGRIHAFKSKAMGYLTVDTLEIAERGVLSKGLMKDLDLLVHDLARQLEDVTHVAILQKPEHAIMYEKASYTPMRQEALRYYEKPVMKPRAKIDLTNPQQEAMERLADAVSRRHANAISAREQDRKLINELISSTPARKRNAAFWDMFQERRSREVWENYWNTEKQLFRETQRLRRDLMTATGHPVPPPPILTKVDRLTPAHVAYLFQTTGDNLNRSLTKVGAMTKLRPKEQFTVWVHEAAEDAAQKAGTTADALGFTEEAIGDVYDQMLRSIGVDPQIAATEPLIPAMNQLEEVRQALHLQSGLRRIPENDFLAYREYINNIADDLDKLPIFRRTKKGEPTAANRQWWDAKEEAMRNTRKQYELDFTDYTNDNMIDAAMKMIFPFWTYEMQRWMWVPRAMLTRPAIATGLGRYISNTDQGYIPIPGTDIQFNPLRGTVFMGGFRRLALRDYPEYYDAMPGMEFIDAIGRFGFYPGAQIMLPIVAAGSLTGRPEWGEVAPSWLKTGINAVRAISPEAAGSFLDTVFPDRFRSYLTMLTLGSMGYDADEIWRKKKEGKALTEEEEKLWLQAEAKATGLKGILFEQTGVFRLRPEEYTQVQEDMKKIIEDMTGIPVRVQEVIQRRYPVTGKRLTDYYDLDVLQQKIIYEQEAYNRFKGVTTPLYPSGWQALDARIADYYDFVDQLYTDLRTVGLFDRDGVQTDPSIRELNQQLVNGEISPDQWIGARGDIMMKASAITQRVALDEYPDVPLSLDEREQYYKDRGMPVPTRGPSQELLYLYYELRPEKRYNWESGRDEWDFDTYYAQIDALLESLDEEQRSRFLERIQYEWTPLEKLYWQISREYLRPYRLMRNLVSQQYTAEQRRLIARYEVARGDERASIMEVLGPDGNKLISGFQSLLSEARKNLRQAQPSLDAWLYFWGITDTFQTREAEDIYNQRKAEYLIDGIVK